MSVKQENGGLLPTCAIKQEAREDNNSGVNPTSRNTTRPIFASPTISDVSMIQWPNRNGSRGSLAKGGDSPWPLFINDIAGRSISGNLASNRARFANSRRNTVPLLSPDSTSNFALIHQADSTFSLDHELVGPSPTPNFSSPRHSALFSGRKRPFSISPCSTGSLDLNALIRTSPSSLVAYVNNSRGSSAGSIGHLSPSLLVSNPITLQRIQSRLSRPVSKQRQSTADSDTSSAAVVKTEAQDVNKMMDSSELYCHSDRVVKSQLEAVAEENCSSENEDMITDHGTSESAVTESETERRDKPPRVKTKREYFSYPIHEEPHNNHCLWENCSEQFNSLDELVAHINSIHIYQESKKNFICRWQGCIRGCKEFKAQYMLLVHMRRHTGEKPHKCNFEGCEKAYSRLENLKTHLRSHTGERPYVCKFSCGKAFSNASDCAKHENRTHSNARPYVCKNNGCSKCYTDPSSLRKHMKTCTVSKKPKQEDTTGTEEESSNELNISTKTSVPKKTTKCRQKKRAAPPVLMKTNSNDFGYVSSDGGGVVHGFPEWSHPQSSGYDTEYNSWKSDHLPAGIVALQNGMLSPMSPQQTTNPPFVTSAVPPTQQYTTVNQPAVAPPPVYTMEQHPVPVDVKGNPPHYIIQSQLIPPQELANHMGYKSHTFPTLPNLPANRNMTHHYSIQVTNDSTAHRKLSETSSGISSLTAGSRNQSLRAVPVKAGHKYRKDSADSSFSTDRSSNASSFHSSLTGGRSIGQVPHSPYPSPPESRQSSQYSYSCSERSHPASWHGDSNGSTKQLYNGFNCDMNLINRRSSNGVNKTLRHHASGIVRTKDYVQNLPHSINSSGFSNVEPLPLPASMRIGAQSPVHGMEIGGMEPGGYVDQASPMQVSGDVPCSDVGCMVVANEPLVKGTQPLCHLEPTQLPPPSYETSIHYKTFQHVSMEPSNHSNMMIGDMANMMYPSKGCYDNGARF